MQETGVDIYADDTTIHAALKERKTVEKVGRKPPRNWLN